MLEHEAKEEMHMHIGILKDSKVKQRI